MRAQFIAAEAARGLRRNVTMTVAMVVTVATSLALLGAALLISSQVDRMKGYWYDKVEVSVFLCSTPDSQCATEVTPSQRDQIQSTLSTLPAVAKVYHESKQEAYSHFVQQFKDSPELTNSVSADALPESFRVKLHNPEQYLQVAQAVRTQPGVATVIDQRQTLSRFFSVMDGFQAGALVLALLQVVVAAVLIANTVRVAAYSRRREIGIMRLVGASKWGIRLPFLLEGIAAGLFGSLLAVGALAEVKHELIDVHLAKSSSSIPFIGWGTFWVQVPILIGVGLLLSGAASLFTLRRHLKV